MITEALGQSLASHQELQDWNQDRLKIPMLWCCLYSFKVAFKGAGPFNRPHSGPP
jgi:hypothetical protein